MIGAITIGGPVMHLMFGSKYMASILLFKILAVGTLCFAMITPPYSALLSMFAPRRTLVITVLGLVLVLVGGAVVMPAYGAVGTAALMTCVRIILAGVVTLLATPLTKERPALAFSRVGAE
jgi:O-antigen/teichoic acid export membrane protein